jgi:DNA replication and repair protein RecF
LSRSRQQLLKLRARDFRNLRELELSPGPRFNVIAGDNGQGKSNLLEAIDYLGTLRSFRGASAEELVRDEAPQAELFATTGGEVLPHEHRVRLARTGARREVQLDGKRPRSRVDYAQTFPVVVFQPGDLSLTTGAPEPRRAFLDQVLERLDVTYATSLAAYTKALASRNRLLKAERPQLRAITAYDELLASAGAVIGQSRAALVEALAPRVTHSFAEISGEGPGISVAYESKVAPSVEALRNALAETLEKDLARGFTGVGPHGDELQVRLQEHKARRYASQGQHRAIVLALKVAELLELEKRTGRTPLLLLDDVSSELDSGRNRRFFGLLADLGGQVFLTTTQPALILAEGEREDFRMQAGVISR